MTAPPEAKAPSSLRSAGALQIAPPGAANSGSACFMPRAAWRASSRSDGLMVAVGFNPRNRTATPRVAERRLRWQGYFGRRSATRLFCFPWSVG